MKRLSHVLFIAVILVLSLSAIAAAEDVIQVNFWCAPGQRFYDFWLPYVEAFNAAKVECDGKVVEIKFQNMTEEPSSEAGIQSAIATGTIPALSENISISFAKTLQESGRLYDLKSEDWFQEIAAERGLSEILKAWEIDGGSYVLPVYVNPLVLVYNSAALRYLGVEVPQTTEDLAKLEELYLANKEGLSSELGVSHLFYGFDFVKASSGYKRWYDFEAPYLALSGGTGMIQNGEAAFDKDVMKAVYEMYGKMGKELLLGEVADCWTADQSPVVMGVGFCWKVANQYAAGKTYGYENDFVYGPELVSEAGNNPYTFADSKGLVLYKADNISEEEHNGAITFLKWVFLDGGKDTFDADWIKATNQLPLRGDVETYEPIQATLEGNPALKDAGRYVAYAMPGFIHGAELDALAALGENSLYPYLLETTAREFGDLVDASEYVDAGIEAMTEVIEE